MIPRSPRAGKTAAMKHSGGDGSVEAPGADPLGGYAGRPTVFKAAVYCASPSSPVPGHREYGLVAEVPVSLYGSDVCSESRARSASGRIARQIVAKV
jgi:hypothetical protein